MTVVPNNTKPKRWLNEFAKDVNSQGGEDGIIEKALEVIGNSDHWCVEFGAWDGMHISNTYNLIKNRGYSAVLIEGDPKKFRELEKNFKGNRNVNAINALVGFGEEDGLGALLKTTDIPTDFDLLSIDIDGNDYHVWEALQHYKTKIVVIEYNPTIPTAVEFVQARDMRVNQGSSLLSINKLARLKGYDLVAVTQTNAIFVDSKYFGLFGIKDNSPGAMRADESAVTHIFTGYDGTVFIRGCGKLCWHGISYKEAKVQQLPKWLRKYPGNYGTLKRILARLHWGLRKRSKT